MKIKEYIDVIEIAQRLVEETASIHFAETRRFFDVRINPERVDITDTGTDDCDAARGKVCAGFESGDRRADKCDRANDDLVCNKLFYADNLPVLKSMISMPQYREKLNLIYIDPPFFTKSDHHAVSRVGGKNIKHPAYGDGKGHDKKNYLAGLVARLTMMKELLAKDGLIWIHLDWHVVHYAKVLMDEIFGEKNFINEVIWTYKSGGSGKRRFSRKHDNLLLYAKSSKYKFNPLKEKSYNRRGEPYCFKGVEEYEDEKGWYTLVNMKDVWGIDVVGRTSNERTGYATQKPELLLRRIIEASTDKGDLCGDFFSGSGTLAAVAAGSGRNFVACDESGTAIENSVERLLKTGCDFRVFEDESIHTEREMKGAESSGVEVVVSGDPAGCKKSIKTVGAARAKASLTTQEYRICLSDITARMDTIRYWAVDADYDGAVFRPQMVFLRENGKLKNSCLIEKEKLFKKRVLVKVYDVFGNIFYKLL